MKKKSLDALIEYDFYEKRPVDVELARKNVKLKWGDYRCSRDGLTIVLITYKRLEALKQAIKSVLNQTKKEFQLLVLDNAGITDGISDVEEYINSINDGRIIYYQQDEEEVLRDNINSLYDAGVVLAHTNWITIMHDDDILHPEFVETMSCIVKKIPGIDGISCNTFSFRNGDVMPDGNKSGFVEIKRYDDTVFKEYFSKPFLGTVINRDVYLKIGFHCNYLNIEGLSAIDDYVFMLRLSHECNVVHVNRKLYGHRIWNKADSSIMVWDDTVICCHYLRVFWAKRGKGILSKILVQNAMFFTILQIEHLSNPQGNEYGKNLIRDKGTICRMCGIDEYKYQWKWGAKLLVVRLIVKILELIGNIVLWTKYSREKSKIFMRIAVCGGK